MPMHASGERQTQTRCAPIMLTIGSARRIKTQPSGKRLKEGGLNMSNVVTVREAVKRAKQDGYPVSEYTLRQWIRTGAIPVRQAGAKILLYYPNLLRYLQCVDGGDNKSAAVAEASGIRRVEL